MKVEETFIAEAARRLDAFYGDLHNYGEVAPGVRFRLEGFLEAGLSLQLVERNELDALIQAAYKTHMGQEPTAVPGDGLQLPVRWRRAPVYPSGGV
jgi:hypothetical protein